MLSATKCEISRDLNAESSSFCLPNKKWKSYKISRTPRDRTIGFTPSENICRYSVTREPSKGESKSHKDSQWHFNVQRPDQHRLVNWFPEPFNANGLISANGIVDSSIAKHACINCSMSFPSMQALKLHMEVCQEGDENEVIHTGNSSLHEPPKKKTKRPPPALIPLWFPKLHLYVLIQSFICLLLKSSLPQIEVVLFIV